MMQFALFGVLASATALPVYQGPLVYQTYQPQSYQQTNYPNTYMVPVRFEVKPEDVSSGVSGFLHNQVSPNVAWYWVRGQKWKWNQIHQALQSAGIPGGWAPYPPTFDESRFGSIPFTQIPIVTQSGSSGGSLQLVPVGPSYIINKKK